MINLFGNRGKRLPPKKKIKTMNIILVIVAIILIVYTIVALWMFYMFQQEPTTLTTCIFTALAGECGIMGWIKTAKVKHQQKLEQSEEDNNCGSDQSDDNSVG